MLRGTDAPTLPGQEEAAEHEHRHGGVSQPHLLVKCALFLGLGGYFGYLWLSGDLGNYINTRYLWLSILAAALFLLLGANAVGALVRSGRGAMDYGHHDTSHTF